MASDEQQRYEALFRAISRVQRTGLFVCWGTTIVITFAFGLAGALVGPDLPATWPRWLAFLTILLPFAAAIIVIPSLAQWFVIRGRTVRALEALGAFTLYEAQEYRNQTGRAVPTLLNVGAARRWLARGEGSGTRVRVRIQIWAGQLDEAAAAVAALPSNTPIDRFHQALLRQVIEFTATGSMDLTEARGMLDEIPRSPDREFAMAALAFEEARVDLASGADYLTRLADARSRLTVLPRGASIRERFIAGLPSSMVPLAVIAVLLWFSDFA